MYGQFITHLELYIIVPLRLYRDYTRDCKFYTMAIHAHIISLVAVAVVVNKIYLK